MRHWIGRLPKLIDELYRGAARRLTNFLDDDLVKGRTELARRVELLEAYAGLRPDFASAGPGSGTVAAPEPKTQPTPLSPSGDGKPDATSGGAK